jgi:selenocysteine lyase/cysteine desulfurase
VAAAWRDRAERNPHRFNRVELPPLIAAARERAAGFPGLDPSRTAWVRNVSEGVSAVLGLLELRPRDELVMGTHGYGAVAIALRHHAARAGAEVAQAAYPAGPPWACSQFTLAPIRHRADVLPLPALTGCSCPVGQSPHHNGEQE